MDAHHTANHAPPALYPLPGPAEAIMAFSVRAALLTLDDRLQAATEEYAAASAALDEATIALHEARMQLEFAEDTETARLLPTIVARNAEERKAALADALWATEVVDEARTHRDGCLAAHTRAEGRFRVVDRTCKDLNRRLAALTALVGGDR